MQTNPSTLVSHSVGGLRAVRMSAALLAAAALAAGAVLAAEGRDPAPKAAGPSGGAVSELSTYDGAILHHHGVRVPVDSTISREASSPRRAAIERFHHFR